MGGIAADQLPRFHMGPMSLNTVHAALAVAYRHQARICLIASRRQIECAALGGGYVNHWTTEDFAKYIRAHDPQNLILLARDHGGPYQHDSENGFVLPDALKHAQISFEADILAGFKVLHLDPEKAVDGSAPDAKAQFTQLTVDMMRAAHQFAVSRNIKDVVFEVGTDEGIGQDFTAAEWDHFLQQVMDAAAAGNINPPVSFAAPMGTKVRGTRNIGAMAAHSDETAEWRQRIAELQVIAQRHGVILKLHNSDYISRDVMDHFISLGVRCMNVAPEFGVIESRRMIEILRSHHMTELAAQFEQTALKSGKWMRWQIPGSHPGDMEKVLMAGHYVFSDPAVASMRAEAAQQLAAQGIQLDTELQQAIEGAIEHYLLPLTGIHAPDVHQRIA